MPNTDRDSLKTTARTWQSLLDVAVLSPDPYVSNTMRQCLAELWAAVEALAGGPQSSQDPLPTKEAQRAASLRKLSILAR